MRGTRSLVAWLVVSALVVACSPGRPELSVWRERWDDLRASMPALADLEPPVDETLCDDVLANIRLARNDLVPAPDPTLDSAVHGWLEVAEEAFFECPPRSGDIQGFDEAYAELARFEAEIDASIGSS